MKKGEKLRADRPLFIHFLPHLLASFTAFGTLIGIQTVSALYSDKEAPVRKIPGDSCLPESLPPRDAQCAVGGTACWELPAPAPGLLNRTVWKAGQLVLSVSGTGDHALTFSL